MQAGGAERATGRIEEPRNGFLAVLPGWLRGMVEKMQGRVGSRRMELAETLNLGGKRQLALVVVDGRRYLVGLGDDSVHAIEALPPLEGGGGDTAISFSAASEPGNSAPGRFN